MFDAKSNKKFLLFAFFLARLSGYRSYNSVADTLFRVAPHLAIVPIEGTLEEYKNYWGSLTLREEEEYISKYIETIQAV